jgi:hypothetical protein
VSFSLVSPIRESSVSLCMEPVPHLNAAKDRSGRFSGYYKCSECLAEFRPNPSKLREMAFFFAAHLRLSHPAPVTNGKDGAKT